MNRATPAATAAILARFHGAPAALPKHARLREAVVRAIEAGELAAGTKLAGERDLGKALGLSLGTTQKALGQLVAQGFLVRKQGHGTFAGSARQPIGGAWHLRFVAPGGGAELPVFATIVGRDLVSAPGPWSQALGADAKGYVHVHRQLDVGGQFMCLSHMYLGASRFAKLLRMAPARLADSNLKTVLAREFSAPTLASQGLAALRPLSLQDAAALGLPAGSLGLELEIVGRSFGHAPISFQRVLVPPTPCGLKIDFLAPGQAPAAAGPLDP